MNERAAVMTPELARRMIRATERVEAMPQGQRTQRPLGPRSLGNSGVWVKVSSTTVTNGTQPGNLYTYQASDNTFSAAGLAVRVKQINGYVLATGKYLRAQLEGADASGNQVFSTSDQTGIDGTKVVCDNVGTKTYTYENGIVTSVA